ncbi:MAG: bifunctional methionine sulfoxide reductase B/A protein [Thermoguttaceae bacterium]
MQYNKLTAEEEGILLRKGTERAGSGALLNNMEKGTYLCKRCDSPLYDSDAKFESHCGWPSFDAEIEGAVTRVPDSDGVRTEIICNACGGHLGHVFTGEQLTPRDTRHCVNSLSMKFIRGVKLRSAYFASGCFWGTEYFFSHAEGVKPPEGETLESLLYAPTTVGYMGGNLQNPSYKDVSKGKTGHAETLRVIYDADKTDYETLLKLFFETHDFTQIDRQGPDVGPQYRSEIFYVGNDEKELSQKYIELLKSKGYRVATKLEKASVFWIAEKYHQQYYDNAGETPKCHVNRKLFD